MRPHIWFEDGLGEWGCKVFDPRTADTPCGWGESPTAAYDAWLSERRTRQMARFEAMWAARDRVGG